MLLTYFLPIVSSFWVAVWQPLLRTAVTGAVKCKCYRPRKIKGIFDCVNKRRLKLCLKSSYMYVLSCLKAALFTICFPFACPIMLSLKWSLFQLLSHSQNDSHLSMSSPTRSGTHSFYQSFGCQLSYTLSSGVVHQQPLKCVNGYAPKISASNLERTSTLSLCWTFQVGFLHLNVLCVQGTYSSRLTRTVDGGWLAHILW